MNNPPKIVIEKSILRRIEMILAEVMPEGSEVYLFGSRATGEAKAFSDVDLAVDNNGQAMPEEVMTTLRIKFEFSDLPFEVDVVDLNVISEEFREAIEGKLVNMRAIM